jgi:hypothetical protein
LIVVPPVLLAVRAYIVAAEADELLLPIVQLCQQRHLVLGVVEPLADLSHVDLSGRMHRLADQWPFAHHP